MLKNKNEKKIVTLLSREFIVYISFDLFNLYEMKILQKNLTLYCFRK